MTASNLLALLWGGVMIGRFMGSFALSDIDHAKKNALIVSVPVIAFLVVAYFLGIGSALLYGVLLAVLLGAVFVGGSSAPRLLALFGMIIIALLGTSMATTGQPAMWTLLGVGMFCSVMWSNIFSLAIEGLGPLKSQASSLLIMAILGGAVLPPMQGFLADRIGIQASFVVPMIAFAYVAFYGIYGYRAGRRITAETVA